MSRSTSLNTATNSNGHFDGPAATSAPLAANEVVTVESAYRGTVTQARVLTFPAPAPRGRIADVRLLAGAALVAAAMTAFVIAAASAERLTGGGGLGATILVCLLAGIALAISGFAARLRPRTDFTVGWGKGADAPVPSTFAAAPAHPLVAAWGDGDYVVNLTPAMDGSFDTGPGGPIRSLAEFAREHGRVFPVPRGGSTVVVCGETTFRIARAPAPATVPRRTWRWNPALHPPALASAAGLLLLLLVVRLVPSDPKSLSLDGTDNTTRYLPFTITPPVPAEDPALKLVTSEPAGGKEGRAERGEAGAAGDKKAPQRDARLAIKGPRDNVDPHLARQLAADRARNAGVLGVLATSQGSHIASIFSREDTALGTEAEDALGHLYGAQIGDAYGAGGLHQVGTGEHGGGTGEAVLGDGSIDTVGTRGRNGLDHGTGYGTVVGRLGTRRAVTPNLIPGIASVRGSLDKEIVRRIVRRHLNEVRFCYEQQLTRHPGLGGRMVVQFTIAGNGQVLSSVLQSSTLGNAVVEGCTVQAVRRWGFPAPEGAGIVIVSYPFVMAPAGGDV